MATLSAKEAARELGTDARNFRKFMRTILDKEDQPGQGNRYHIEEKAIPGLKKKFADWSKPKAKPSENGAEAEEILDEELLDEDMLVEEELTDEDINEEFEDSVDEEPVTEEELEDSDDEFDLEEL